MQPAPPTSPVGGAFFVAPSGFSAIDSGPGTEEDHSRICSGFDEHARHPDHETWRIRLPGDRRIRPVLELCRCDRLLDHHPARFLGEVEGHLHAINDVRQELKNNLPFGALPETAEAQYNAFLVSTLSCLYTSY